MGRVYTRTKDYSKRTFFKDQNNIDKVCSLYREGNSSLKISKLLNVSKSSILKTLKNNNILARTNEESHKIFDFDENIFEKIDSHEKAYWIGFLQADATITGNRLVLALALKDKNHVEKFKLFLNSNHNIHIYKQLLGKNSIVKNKNKDYFYAYLGISSSKLLKDLEKYSITKNKSFTVEFGKNIPTEYLCSYMAGLVDADGFITLYKKSICFGFMSHSKFVYDFRKTITDICELKLNKIMDHHTSKKIKIIRYAGKNAITALKFIYSMSPIYLNRKKEKLNLFL